MARRDKVHDIVRNALEREGWTITNDPLVVKIGRKSGEIDLGAERILAAEKGQERIAVEIKSFIGSSTLTEFYRALGQFNLYGRALKNQHPDRLLYLALPLATYKELSDDIFDFPEFEDLRHRIIIFEPIDDTTLTWIK
jgi:XisH protein